jgi:PAS domain S-box-containing protein
MNPTARRAWVLLFWMAAVFGIHMSLLARQACSAGTAPVMDARPGPAASGEKVSLTAQERQWLSLHDGAIRIGITVIPPQVLKGGTQYSGLSIDYIRLLERKLGCRFKLVPYATWHEVIQAAKARRIDTIFAAQQTPECMEYLLFTEPYIELPNMIIVRRDQPGGGDLKAMQGWRVATSQGSAVHEYLKREFPDLDLLPVTDELSGLMKVSVGEADAMVVEISRASYYIEKAGILNLRVSGDAGLLYRLRFAVRSDWPVLVGILDKGLAAVTDEEKRDIKRRWIVVGERRVFPGRAFWIVFAIGLAVIASAVAGVFVWNRMLSRLVRQRTLQLQQELAEREKSEYALVRLNRQLRAISTCNMVLMQTSDEQTLLNDVCRIVCEEAGYRMAWVGYPQKDDARTVRPAAWAGVEEGYLAEAGITWADTEPGRGPTGRAIRAGVSACIQDFATDPHAAPWRQSALQRGYRSSIALPLMDENGTAFGALCIYSAQPGTFTSEEMKLLDELAGNLAFGITTLRIRAEHKEAERQVFAGEQLFRALVENSPDFIARYDREFRRIYVNPAIKKLFGGEQAENVIGRTPLDQSPLYAPQVYVDHLRQAIETAAESTAEIPFRTAQGEMHWGHIRFVPEFGPDGHVVSVLAIGRDIHEIKENERRFRMLAENFPDFVARFDRDGHYTFANPAIEKAFGIPVEAIIGKSLRELPPGRKPEQNDALLVLIRRAFDEGVANESEVRWDTESGERVYEIRHAPEKDATGSVVSVLGIARDITERKQMEEALSASEAELRTLIKAMTDVIIVSDSEGRYLKIVDTSPSLLYKPPNELLGRTLHEVFSNDQADFFLDHIRQALDTQQSVNFEYNLPIGNKELWFNATISPMSDDKTLMVARDITEGKTAEEALRRLNIELDRRVLNRTAQLEDANKELEAFAYSVSHDLRAPLRHINGFIGLLQKKTDALHDEQSRHYMDNISESVEKMGLLIDDLLSFSRMGRHAMLIQPLELEPLVRDVIREFEPDAAGRNIDWRIGDLPAVSGDAAMLRMVLANLISNALKFTRPRQQARIEIGTLPGQASETVIFMRDNGVGFDMAYRDKLFGVFQRLHRVDEFEGTGIGLANVRRIIARHGGRTWAEAEPDRGAIFFFSLPLAQPGDGR